MSHMCGEAWLISGSPFCEGDCDDCQELGEHRLVKVLMRWDWNNYDLAAYLDVSVRSIEAYRAELRTRHDLPPPPRGKLRNA